MNIEQDFLGEYFEYEIVEYIFRIQVPRVSKYHVEYFEYSNMNICEYNCSW